MPDYMVKATPAAAPVPAKPAKVLAKKVAKKGARKVSKKGAA